MVMLMYRLPEASLCWIPWKIRRFIYLPVSPCMFIYIQLYSKNQRNVCIYTVLANASILANRVSVRPHIIHGNYRKSYPTSWCMDLEYPRICLISTMAPTRKSHIIMKKEKNCVKVS